MTEARQDSFYVTTPIYYVNDVPHIGHAYSTVAADVLARYARLRGRPTRFLTGTDEHGQKIAERASSMKMPPQSFVDRMSPPFRAAFEQLDCSFDDYIRTTEARHEAKVRELWQVLEGKGDIYLGEYEGWYSVQDEAFITDTEYESLDEVTRQGVRRISEPSYFFRLSAYTERLLDLYERNPHFVRPEGRLNEVKAFVKGGLRDLSVSRTSFDWGVPVPGDEEHVMFVWLDALTNYISALGGPAPDGAAPLFDQFWGSKGQQIHIVGKDILRFHAVYWPAFLLSAGIDPPTTVYAHGWLTINGQKMSKRYGNFIPPGPLVEAFGADVLRYYLMREVGFGQDGDFAHKHVLARYNGELANGLGNLLNRIVTSIVRKQLGGVVPPRGEPTDQERDLLVTAERVARDTAAHLDEVQPHRALERIWELVSATNKYVDQTAPWALAKSGDNARLNVVAYTVLEALRWVSVMITPFMPDKAQALRQQLGLAPLESSTEVGDQWPSAWGELEPGTRTEPSDPLFPRIHPKEQAKIFARFGLDAQGDPPPADVETEDAASETTPPVAQLPKTAKQKKTEDLPEGVISFDQFLSVELKLGLVQEAEVVSGSDKLLRLQIDLGEATPRQVLAGIRAHYAPDELVGKRVVVVANLAPRRIFGLESQGMVLAASDENAFSVLTIDEAVAPGTRIE